MATTNHAHAHLWSQRSDVRFACRARGYFQYLLSCLIKFAKINKPDQHTRSRKSILCLLHVHAHARVARTFTWVSYRGCILIGFYKGFLNQFIISPGYAVALEQVPFASLGGNSGGKARAGEATIRHNALFLAREFPIHVSSDKFACNAPNNPIKVPKTIHDARYIKVIVSQFSLPLFRVSFRIKLSPSWYKQFVHRLASQTRNSGCVMRKRLEKKIVPYRFQYLFLSFLNIFEEKSTIKRALSREFLSYCWKKPTVKSEFLGRKPIACVQTPPPPLPLRKNRRSGLFSAFFLRGGGVCAQGRKPIEY